MSTVNSSIFFRLHLTVFIYGFTGILGELISIEAIPLVWHRMWIAALFVLIYLGFRKRLDFRIGKNFWEVVVVGVIIAAHWVTFFHAIKISTVSVALVCLSTGAFFGSILGPVFSRSKIDRREMLMGILVIIGLYIIFRFEGDYTAGIITALLSAFLSALFSVMNARLIKTYRPNHLTFFEMLIGWLAISSYIQISGDLNMSLLHIAISDWIYLAILGSVCTAYAFIESVTLMHHISPFTFLLAINMEPIYAIILALIFFNEGEKLNPLFFVGATIIISTVFLDTWLKKRAKSKRVTAK